jgi:hypothetical protein
VIRVLDRFEGSSTMAAPPPEYDVEPEVLDEGARMLDGVAGEICGARQTLVNHGGLPTLDPLSRAVKLAAGYLGVSFPAFLPIGVWGSGAATEAIMKAIDPYPPIRNAWEDALGRYCRMVGDNASGLHKTAEEYRRREDWARSRLGRIYTDPAPIPTVRPGDDGPVSV